MLIEPCFMWSTTKDTPTAATVTRGTLILTTPTEQFWGNTAFEWTWVELLEWLNENWVELHTPVTEETNPWATHNLQEAIQGATVPALTIWRTKTQGFLETSTNIIGMSLNQWENLLTEISTNIAKRLTFSSDQRARAALKNWLDNQSTPGGI